MSEEICDVENCPSYDADYETHCEGLPMGEDVKGCFTRKLSKENSYVAKWMDECHEISREIEMLREGFYEIISKCETPGEYVPEIREIKEISQKLIKEE